MLNGVTHGETTSCWYQYHNINILTYFNLWHPSPPASIPTHLGVSSTIILGNTCKALWIISGKRGSRARKGEGDTGEGGGNEQVGKGVWGSCCAGGCCGCNRWMQLFNPLHIKQALRERNNEPRVRWRKRYHRPKRGKMAGCVWRRR